MPVSMQTKVTLPKLPRRENAGVARSQTERIWLISGAIVAFVILLIGYFFFISPQRSNTADVNGQVRTAKDQNAVLRTKIEALREENKNLAKYQAELAQARLALPDDSGVPDLLRSLQALGAATQTDVTTLSVGQPTAVAAQPSTQANSDNITGTSPAAASTTASSTPRPTAGVYALTINVTVSGNAGGLERFLDQLQSVQPRAVLITNIKESAPTADNGKQVGGNSTLTLTMEAFVATGASSASATNPVPSPTPTTGH